MVSSAEEPEVAGEFTEKESKRHTESAAEEQRQEAIEAKSELDRITPRIDQLTRLLEAAKKAPLTDEEKKLQQAKVDKAMEDAKRLGSDEDIALRIGKVTREHFAPDLRAGQISDSPQGRELERLKNRQFDLEERLRQIESGE